MAALFALADRGEVAITEGPRALGQRTFAVARMRTGRPLAVHEQGAVDIIFADRDGPDLVSLSKARSRLARRLRKFSTAVEAEMTGADLMDEGRRTVRRRYMRVGIVAMLGGSLVAVPLALFVDQYQGWPMLIPGALVMVSVAALICAAAHSVLSNDGVRRARQWRGFQKYLTEVARDRAHSPSDGAARLLPLAVAVGLAPAWSKYLKHHHAHVPAWFRANATSDSGEAFAALVATGGASAQAHGG